MDQKFANPRILASIPMIGTPKYVLTFGAFLCQPFLPNKTVPVIESMLYHRIQHIGCSYGPDYGNKGLNLA